MNPIAKYFLPPFTIMTLHSATVLLRQYQHDEAVKKEQAALESRPQQMAEFRIGSADDIVMDHVKTGDIVYFQRKWHYHHLPMGLLIWSYRTLFQCEYDHVGMILVDATGKPFLLENTPYRGMQCRSLADRIKQSEAEIITLSALHPRTRPNVAQNLLQKSPEEQRALFEDINEYTTLSKSVLKKVFVSLKAKLGMDQVDSQDAEVLIDGQAQFLSTMLSEIGINSVANTQSLNQFIDKEAILVDEKTQQRVSFDRENVLIRTR